MRQGHDHLVTMCLQMPRAWHRALISIEGLDYNTIQVLMSSLTSIHIYFKRQVWFHKITMKINVLSSYLLPDTLLSAQTLVGRTLWAEPLCRRAGRRQVMEG